MANTVASRKAKGRKLQQFVRDRIIECYELSPDDVKSVPGGVSGEDIWLSDYASAEFPYSVECKNTERLNIWKAWEQCERNSKLTPLLVIKRNNHKPLVVLDFDYFIDLDRSV